MKGIILNEESQSPITGVTIQDTLSGFGQISDSEGKFELELKTLPAVIIFKHLGYFDDTLTIQNKNQYREFFDNKTVVISLRINPFLIDEIVISDSRTAIKLFDKEPYALIDFVIKNNRFIGLGYRNYNPLNREVFIGSLSGKIIKTIPLNGLHEIYEDCLGEIYAVTKDSAYLIKDFPDTVIIEPICTSDYFNDKVKPIKAVHSNYFMRREVSNKEQYHEYYAGNSTTGDQEVIYRVGDEKYEKEYEFIDEQVKQEFVGKIEKSWISDEEMRRINGLIARLWHTLTFDYKPAKSEIYLVKDSLLLFDFNNYSINCFDPAGNFRWRTRIKPDLSKDFSGNIHWDKIQNRFFLEFSNIQLTYLIEIDPKTGKELSAVPIRKYKHIDHINIDNNRIFFLHQPDFGDRGKKIYYLDISP